MRRGKLSYGFWGENSIGVVGGMRPFEIVDNNEV